MQIKGSISNAHHNHCVTTLKSSKRRAQIILCPQTHSQDTYWVEVKAQVLTEHVKLPWCHWWLWRQASRWRDAAVGAAEEVWKHLLTIIQIKCMAQNMTITTCMNVLELVISGFPFLITATNFRTSHSCTLHHWVTAILKRSVILDRVLQRPFWLM